MNASDDWAPLDVSDSEMTQMKWGWNRHTGEVTVWEVAGPGDGFPSHNAYLTAAWGRAPSPGGGDIVGFAEWRPPTLSIHSYRAELPDAVERHFRTTFPDARVIVG